MNRFQKKQKGLLRALVDGAGSRGLVAAIVTLSLLLVASPARAITLEEAIAQAEATHPSIRSKALEFESAEASTDAALWQFAPTPSVTSERYKGHQVTSLQLQQPLWTGGQLTAGLDRAKAQQEAAFQDMDVQREEVVAKVISAFGDWAGSQRKLAVARESVEVHRKFFALISRRTDREVSARADKDLGKSRLLLAESDVLSAEAAEQTARARLERLVGKPIGPSETARYSGAANVGALNELLEAALERNPTIKKLQANSSALEAEIDSARAALSPQLYVKVQRQIGDANLPSLPADTRVVFGIQMATGAGLSRLSATSAAIAKHKASTHAIDEQVRQLTEQIEVDYKNYRAAHDRRGRLQEMVGTAGAVKDSYYRQFLVGRKSWLEVLNSERESFQNELALVDADVTILITSHRLQLFARGAVGGM